MDHPSFGSAEENSLISIFSKKAARAAKTTDTSRGCFRSHAFNSSLLFIRSSGPSRHQRPFAAFSMAAPPRFGKPSR
jgi:hypothetical protein